VDGCFSFLHVIVTASLTVTITYSLGRLALFLRVSLFYIYVYGSLLVLIYNGQSRETVTRGREQRDDSHGDLKSNCFDDLDYSWILDTQCEKRRRMDQSNGGTSTHATTNNIPRRMVSSSTLSINPTSSFSSRQALRTPSQTD